LVKDIPYPYGRTLYSRLFLNCYERESLVMLAERGRPVHQLLIRCLVSTDEILRQVIREQRPEYDFESGIFDPDDLARIGIVKEDTEFDSYADARGLRPDMTEFQTAVLLADIALIIAVARIAGRIARRLGPPSVIGDIAVGVLCEDVSA
jgi:hypothetical protein